MDRLGNCNMDSCQNAAVASLAQQDLCLNHFLTRCYEHLDRLDAQRRAPAVDALDLARTTTFVEECSRRAFDVSFRCPEITNLQRGRILDILLWAGDLFIALRAKPLRLAKSSLAKSREASTQQQGATAAT
jgi:hypothetical protein